ncbi:DUF7696 family protein [Pseudoxanthomonas winnipegensis]|uniref:Uncharacterized protein n=1 Tax=Pseudoxanthomonas winnipegensis TaxID=2480810 RepID=A0A4Q8LD98_9GAMM|nr:hypothetical protein [Pseudoxanthomonas winnipegensis]TAA26540.1 hypothetical protein EA660_04725 [Pseudoxanthomonas winnipegensis]
MHAQGEPGADTSGSAHRLQEEARHLLRCGYTSAAKVDVLIERVTVERGKAAAERLREAMRQQWKIRATWWRGAVA